MKKPELVFNYRVRNWANYNGALIRRGSFTVWVDEQAVSGWRDDIVVRSRGRPGCTQMQRSSVPCLSRPCST